MPDQHFTRKLEFIDSDVYSQYKDIDRWAVIVGISKYQNSDINLKYADRDAEDLYQLLLTSNGGSFKADHICKLTNEQATTANITRALRSFLKKPAREDLVLVYFACHGSPDPDRPGNVYLLTHDTDPNDIAGTALPMEDIDRALKGILLSEKVIILADTCHSAAIGGGIGGRRSVVDEAKLMNLYLRDISRSKGGVALLTSAEANEVSFEDTKWGGGHGVFTHYLLEGMRGAADRDGNGIVTIGELFEYVRDSVKQATDYRQHPSIGTNAYDRNLPVAIAPRSDSSQSTKTYQDATGSRSSAAEPTIQENLDITLEVALTIEEMSAGTEKHIVTEQGGIVVKIPAGVSPGKRIRVRSKGRLDVYTQQRGDLYLLIAQRSPAKPEQTTYTPRQGAESFVEDLGNGVTLEMLFIPGGTFMMGQTADEKRQLIQDIGEENYQKYCARELPRHQVTVQPFFMGKFAVTQAQWKVVAALPKVNVDLNPDPSAFKGDRRPVEQVSWHEAVEFCDRLSRKTGRQYRLPSEAEWEYACRAGTTTPFYCGETISTDLANYDGNYTYGSGVKGVYRRETTDVGIFPPNPFGLYDMHGNVREWCADHWHSNYEHAPTDGNAWNTDSEGDPRLARGGSWGYFPGDCRSAYRCCYSPGVRFNLLGFRVVCVLA